MSRHRFLYPRGELSAEIVSDTLALISVDIPPAVTVLWCKFELLMVYDWAMREHLFVGDNRTVRRRQKPWLVTMTEKHMVAVKAWDRLGAS